MLLLLDFVGSTERSVSATVYLLEHLCTNFAQRLPPAGIVSSTYGNGLWTGQYPETNGAQVGLFAASVRMYN